MYDEEYEYEELDSPEWEAKARYAEQLEDDLCPTGFRFFSNISINGQTNQLNSVKVGFDSMTIVEYISMLKEKYGDVQFTEAYDCYGRYIDGWYGVFVKSN